MYKLINAHCLSRSVGSQWQKIDISKSLVSSVFNTFREVFLIIYDSFIDAEVIVNIETFRVAYSSMNVTVQEMLDIHSGLPLEITNTLPSTEIRYAKYSNAVKAGYKFEFTKAGYNLDYEQNSDYYKDLKLTRPGTDTDMHLIHSHCLVTVNGFVHDTDSDNTAAYVYDGATTMRIARDNKIGILSFLDIGRLTKIRFKEDSLMPARIDGTMKERVLIKLDEDIEDDNFLLVLGGYIIFPEEGVFWKHSDKSYYLDITKLPYIERLMESREFIDISSLGISIPDFNENAIDVNDPYTDTVIKKYFLLSQSFFVRVGCKTILTTKFSMNRINTPGSFVLYQAPVYPMFVHNGRMVEYWSQQQGERWSVTVPDSYHRNYALSYRQKSNTQHVDDTLMAQNPIYHRGGLMLEIAGYNY